MRPARYNRGIGSLGFDQGGSYARSRKRTVGFFPFTLSASSQDGTLVLLLQLPLLWTKDRPG